MLFCGKQCIALRGDAEKPETPGNPGNFLALLKLLATNDDILRKHLETPAMRNATYISPQSQNDLIEVIGEQIFQGIVDDVNASPFYAILADEVTSHNVEYLALCVRFFDHKQNTIREEFLAFLPLVRITGEAISAVILGFLSKNQIPASNMRGQGYDGASNMASDSVGVQARIKQAAPLAMYVHCIYLRCDGDIRMLNIIFEAISQFHALLMIQRIFMLLSLFTFFVPRIEWLVNKASFGQISAENGTYDAEYSINLLTVHHPRM